MKLFKLKLIFSLLIILALITILETNALATFVVTPMEFHLNVASSENTTGIFWVRNRGNETISLKVYTGDFWIEPDGREAFLEPGRVERSCSKWIEVAPEELELAPNESKSIRFNLSVPPQKSGTFWAMIFIEQTNKPTIRTAQKGQQQFNIISFQRVGVRIYQETPDSVKGEGKISHVGVERGKKDEFLIVNLKIDNNGDVLLRCKGNVEIKNERGDTVDNVSLDEFNCYPHSSRIAQAPFKAKLRPGQYTALAVIDYGAEYLVAGEAVFKVNAITGSIEMAKPGQAAIAEKSREAVSSEPAPLKPEPAKEIIQPVENRFIASLKNIWTRLSQTFTNLFRTKK